jgi:hypothetical protein
VASHSGRDHRAEEEKTMARRLLLLTALLGLVLLAVPVSAAPPGNDSFTQTWGGGEAGDTYEGFDTFAQIGFSTDDHGNNMWVNLDLWTNSGYGCSFSGLATHWEDDTDLQEIGIVLDFPGGVAMEGGEPGLPEEGSCGDALIYALIIVNYSGADTSKWHTNGTGSQCRGNDVTHEDAYGFVTIETADPGRFGMDGDNDHFWPNYYTSDWRCHSTGTPGNPHR